MKHPNLKDFGAALERAAREFLASRGIAATEGYLLLAESCPVHGPACVRVTYGVLRDHFSLSRSDPAKLAADLLTTMLPPKPSEAPAALEDGELVGAPVHASFVPLEKRNVIPFPRELVQ
jgi:hypothetical protein